MPDSAAFVVEDIKSSGVSTDGQHAIITYTLRGGQETELAFPISMVGHYVSIVESAAKRAVEALSAKTGTTMSGFASRVVPAKSIDFGFAPEYPECLMSVETVQKVTTTYQVPRDILEQMAAGLPGLLSHAKGTTPPEKH